MEDIKFEYGKIIDDLQKGIIRKISFSVQGYGHYKNCSIVCEDAITKSGKIITVTLAKDECCTFYGSFNENEKLFRIKGKGSFTLKEMWDKIQITEVVM